MSCSHGSKGGELWWEQINPAAKTNKIRENIKEELATEKDDETYLPRISSSSSSSSNLSISLASHWVVEPCGIPLLDASTTWLCYNWSWTWENAIKIWYCRLAVANMCKQSLGTWKSKAGETISVQAVNTTEWLDTLQPCIKEEPAEEKCDVTYPSRISCSSPASVPAVRPCGIPSLESPHMAPCCKWRKLFF